MESNLQALKHYIYELEYTVLQEDYEKAKNISRMIKTTVSQVENIINNVTDGATGVYYKHINTIDFLYKPIDVPDPYVGNYLERYAESRAFDLDRAGAKEGHDEFWKEYLVLQANVYGLVPVDLISEMSMNQLMNMGWLRVSVDVLDFGNDATQMREIRAFCQQSFSNYVALKEEQTDATVVLSFAS